MSTSSSHSNSPSYFSSKKKLALINSIKLKGKKTHLKIIWPIIANKYNLYKSYVYILHLFKFVNIPTKDFILFFFNLGSHKPQDLTSKENNSWKQGFMVSPPLKRTFNVLCINLVPLKHL